MYFPFFSGTLATKHVEDFPTQMVLRDEKEKKENSPSSVHFRGSYALKIHRYISGKRQNGTESTAIKKPDV